MKTAPGAVASYLATLGPKSMPWLTDIFTITLIDGTVLRWTSADANIVLSGNTYLAGPVLRSGNVTVTSAMEVDALEVILSAVVQVNGRSIGLMAAQSGFYGARLKLDTVVGAFPGDLSLGPILAWYEGRITSANLQGDEVTLLVDSELGQLDMLMLPKFTTRPGCPHATYDANCGLVKATFTDAGAASGTLSTTQVQSTTAAIIARAAGYYALGVLKFTSGVLNGQRRAVRAFSVGGGVATFTIGLPFGSAPAAADTFTVTAGDDHSQATCVNKFNNLVNFRGFPHVPVSEGGQ